MFDAPFHSSATRFFLAAVTSLVPLAAMAIDGVVLIDQNKALANIAPGDAPGFPVTITQPGSYRLSANLIVPNSNTDAIVVAAPNVTIDLNGFAIVGPNVCTRPASGFGLNCTASGSGIGVTASGAVNVTVMNGTVRGMGNSAIALIGTVGTAPNRVERVAVTSNGSTGIVLINGVIANNSASLNGVHGISLQSGRASGNYSVNNLGTGLYILDGAYDTNTFSANGFAGDGNDVFGSGVNLGQNLCTFAACPGAKF